MGKERENNKDSPKTAVPRAAHAMDRYIDTIARSGCLFANDVSLRRICRPFVEN
jgi:hypothetical protein